VIVFGKDLRITLQQIGGGLKDVKDLMNKGVLITI
jgi:hypothetical protein